MPKCCIFYIAAQIEVVLCLCRKYPMQIGYVLQDKFHQVLALRTVECSSQPPSSRLSSEDEAVVIQRDSKLFEVAPCFNVWVSH